jgi:Undecaprenyl-phosphate glucose phosphotransferase
MVVAELDDRIGLRTKPKHLSLTLVRNLVQIADPVVIAAVGLITSVVYIVLLIRADITSSVFVTIAMGAIGTSVFCHLFDLYNDRFLFSKHVPFDRLTAAWAIVFAILLFVAFALKISSDFSRVWAVSWFVGGACSLVGTRLLMREWIQQQVRSGTLVERAVIFGAGEQGIRFAAEINKHNDPFTQVIGFIDDRATRVPRSSLGYELLGNSQTLVGLIRANKVDQVFIALPPSAKNRLTEVMEELANTPVRVCLVFDALGFKTPNKTIRYIENSPILQIFDRPLNGWSNILKQIEDKLIAALILIFISPLLLCIAAAIKLDSSGPILFRQKRYGFNDKQIEVWKFRSMRPDSANAPETLRQATRNDPRLTRIGHFLRRSSLDELPQFFNVLCNDMSIVGPRPHAVEHMYGNQQLAEMVDRYAARHRVKPGITGWAQVNGWRGETDTVEKLQKRIEHDLHYIENWSIWFDLVIIWKTIFVIFKDETAY